MFHLVSLSLQISLTDLPGSCLGLCVCVACFVGFVGLVVGFFLWGKFDFNHRLIPVVDRPCLALVRQCRKKKELLPPSCSLQTECRPMVEEVQEAYLTAPFATLVNL